jgi:hypothetical protein
MARNLNVSISPKLLSWLGVSVLSYSLFTFLDTPRKSSKRGHIFLGGSFLCLPLSHIIKHHYITTTHFCSQFLSTHKKKNNSVLTTHKINTQIEIFLQFKHSICSTITYFTTFLFIPQQQAAVLTTTNQ